MASNSGLMIISGIILLIFVSIVFISFGNMSIASSDIGAQQNLNNSSSVYQTAYNSSTGTVIVGISFLKYLPILLAFAALIIVLIFLANKAGGL